VQAATEVLPAIAVVTPAGQADAQPAATTVAKVDGTGPEENVPLRHGVHALSANEVAGAL